MRARIACIGLYSLVAGGGLTIAAQFTHAKPNLLILIGALALGAGIGLWQEYLQ